MCGGGFDGLHGPDMLDEFSSTTAAQKPSCSGPGRPAPAAKGKPTTVKAKVDDNEDGINEDFQAQLAQSMAELMGEIDDSPEKRKQLDALMAGLTSEMDNLAKNGDSKAAGATSSNDPAASTTTDDVFQETIRKTLERMQVSEEQASAAATAATEAGAEDPLLQQLLQEMAAQGMGGEGKEGGDEEFSKMLLSMMEQLTNKDILYEPMKELHDKFPEWMKKNKGKVGEADMVRYREQRRLVEEIVDRFEREGYADENPQDREYIVERMQKVSSDV